MKQFLPILVLVCSAWSQAGEPPRPAAPQPPPVSGQAAGSGAAVSAPTTSAPAKSAPAISADQENSRKARALIDQAIQALGGQNYLNIRDREMQGRSYSFHHGRPS